jgi:hypothetical protein
LASGAQRAIKNRHNDLLGKDDRDQNLDERNKYVFTGEWNAIKKSNGSFEYLQVTDSVWQSSKGLID